MGVLLYIGMGALIAGIFLLFGHYFVQQKRRMDMQTPLLACVKVDWLVDCFSCKLSLASVIHLYMERSGERGEHRVNAATREAESGFIVCPGCEFENFKRYSYCNLCGERLTTESDNDTDGQKSKKVWKWRAGTQEPTLTQPAAPKAFTAQQLRVRKRKEWVRKVDVNGNMFWYRSCVDGISGDLTGTGTSTFGAGGLESQQPGYVAVFQRSESSSDREPVVVVGAGAAVDANPTLSSESQSRSATTMDSSFKMDVFLASAVDAAGMLSLNLSADETRVKVSEIIALTSTDFPTKYAHFSTSASSLIVPANKAFFKLSVHRDYMLEESIGHVSCIAEKNIHSYIRINFLEESGVDAGGVHREWFLQVNELLLNPTLGLFQCTNKSEQTYYLNPNSAFDIGENEHLVYYFAAGRLIGRALLEGGVWGFHLSLPLIKIILGIPVTFSDLEYLDPEAYRSMQWLLANDGVEDIGLDFSVTEKRGDELVTVDLIPDGRNIAVTDTNKREYLERKFHYMVFESVSSQLYMFLKGLYEVIPQELLMLFDAEEFNYLLCGTQEIDVEDWEANTKYSSNLKWNGVLQWFWEVVREMPNEKRRRLLMFATGSSRVPLGGFAGLTSYDGRLCPFALKGVPYSTTQYISSHACFNRLDIPMYKSKEELRTVLLAILDTESYGFTTV